MGERVTYLDDGTVLVERIGRPRKPLPDKPLRPPPYVIVPVTVEDLVRGNPLANPLTWAGRIRAAKTARIYRRIARGLEKK